MILQGICAGIIVAALLTVNYWLDSTWQLSQLGRSFEESAVFLRDVESYIRTEVDRSLNKDLFTKDGVTDLNKEVDIRQYVSGVNDEANRNENLTYRLSDLINYYPQMTKFAQIIQEVLAKQGAGIGKGADGTWETLAQEAESLEVILPVSGKTLAQTARASQTPFETLLQYYQSLILTSSDIHDRYLFYEDEAQASGGGLSYVPGNIAYYIENTTTKQSFTNLGQKGVAAARNAVLSDPGLTFLFDGVRTKDVMVANTELTLNEEAATWFMDTQFQGENERVTIAVNLSYPAGDELRRDYLLYQKRKPMVILALTCGGIALALLVVLFVMGIHTTGRADRHTCLKLKGFDLIPTEIALGLCLVAALSWYYLGRMLLRTRVPYERRSAWIVLMAIVEYEIILASILSMVRRIRSRKLWSTSVTCMAIRVSSQVLEARAASTRIMIAYVVSIFLNFVFLRYFGMIGVVSAIVLDLALLLYLLRDRLGKLSVRAGLRELSKGKLDYRIDTGSLTGDSLEMAQAVNEMGDGLQEAVDTMVRSERLKAELITNLSHDLKTPLTSIINYVDLLKRENPENERQRQYIEVLERKSMRLKSLITDLIDVSRISSGNVELHMAKLDLRPMVQMAAGEFEDRFEQIPLTVQMEAKKSLPVMADGDMLWRVFDNLLGNIAKYAKPGSVVKIRIYEEDGTAVCLFENESKDTLSKSGQELQERFVRGDVSRSSEGSGLGLSIAGSLTQLMGGTFQVETTPDIFRAIIRFESVG